MASARLGQPRAIDSSNCGRDSEPEGSAAPPGIGRTGSTATASSVPTGSASAPCSTMAPSGEWSTALPEGV